MTAAAKIQHATKGIDDDVFQMLLAKFSLTVADVVTLCQSYDQLRKQRALTRRPYQRDEPLAGLSFISDHSSLVTQIKTFVCEEVTRQLSLVSTVTQHPDPPPQLPQQQPTSLASMLRHAIQEQIADALPVPV